jgi:hypothetical protein
VTRIKKQNNIEGCIINMQKTKKGSYLLCPPKHVVNSLGIKQADQMLFTLNDKNELVFKPIKKIRK